jgi:outer membrane protein OmpA-like peptidoglycan-associated protein
VERLDAKGNGEKKPVASNATSKGKALNRRIEFVVFEN